MSNESNTTSHPVPEGFPLQDLSRRRSLPALAKVREKVVTMQGEARGVAATFKLAGDVVGEACFKCVGVALDEVFKTISEVEHEEPEGNTQAEGS